ncbi:hypothetical protein OT109_18655 [Phycisphaeraceae bacterium D3-23]
MMQLTYSDEFFEYHGLVSLDGREIAVHFPLYEPTTESEILAKHDELISMVASRFQWLVEQAVKLNFPHHDLPEVNALIIDEDGTFDLQFGSSAQQEELWCEVFYEVDGVAYHFERHPPHGVA